jgi:light-regulated signal transduction histidine kinase (bacteriophytochrome)
MSMQSTSIDESSLDIIRLLQEELAQTNREVLALTVELEKRVEKRTSELQEANRQLESFSYSVSHDLRAPLRAINGFTQILLQEYSMGLSPEGQRLLNLVVANTRRMDQLIEGLLRLARLGRQALAKKPVNISALVKDITEMLLKESKLRDLSLEIEPLPDSIGDESLLRQVFTNLLSNAFKFTQKTEKPQVFVGFRDQRGERVYFVRDNGAGFEMEYADKLFGVFQRLHRAEDFDGTGIGLSIVQRIVQRHGGRIWAEGAVAKGATFYFTLPASDEASRAGD